MVIGASTATADPPAFGTETGAVEAVQPEATPVHVSRRSSSRNERVGYAKYRPSELMGEVMPSTPLVSSLPLLLSDTRFVEGVQPAGAEPKHVSCTNMSGDALVSFAIKSDASEGNVM